MSCPAGTRFAEEVVGGDSGVSGDWCPGHRAGPVRDFCYSRRLSAFVNKTVRRQWCARVDGSDHGPYRELGPGNRLQVAGQFVDGRFHGTWIEWSPAGEVVRIEQFARGKLVARNLCR